MKTKKAVPSTLVRVIRDSSDGSRDYWIEREEAEKLFEESRLAFDLTNNCYCEIGGGK